jgi:hypothetical protein
MTNPHKLSEFTDMPKEKFQECLERVDMKVFIENPTKALIDAGVTLKEGIALKYVETEEEANALPANVLPLMRTKKNNEELSMQDLDKVAGGEDVYTGPRWDWGPTPGSKVYNPKGHYID